MDAHSVLKKYVRVKAHVLAKVESFARRSGIHDKKQPLLGIHMRGTDKAFGGGPVPPEHYYPYVDCYLQQHPGAMIYVATDTSPWLKAMRDRYGKKNRVLSLDGALRSGSYDKEHDLWVGRSWIANGNVGGQHNGK